MRYKGDFIGLNLEEEKVLIEYIVKAFKHSETLPEEQQFLLGKAIRIIADNQEFTKTTFDQLLELLYLSLYFAPIKFHRDKKGGYYQGGWYRIPTHDLERAAKRLNNRAKKRHRFIDGAWYKTFNESFDWEILFDEEQGTQIGKDNMRRSLGKDRTEVIRDDRDPRSAVIVPFKNK